MRGTEKTGSHWRKKAIWGHRKKRELRWYDQIHKRSFYPSSPASCLQHVFLFGRPLCCPTLARCGPPSSPQWRLCALCEWQTCPPPTHTHIPPPPSVSHPLHTCKKTTGLHNRFSFRKQCSMTDMTKAFYTSNFRLPSRNVASEGHVAALITGTGRFCLAPLMPFFFFNHVQVWWASGAGRDGSLVLSSTCNWFPCFHYFVYTIVSVSPRAHGSWAPDTRALTHHLAVLIFTDNGCAFLNH